MFSILKKQTLFTIRHLGEHSYGTSVARGAEFANTMKTLSAKGKQLKKEGKGNKDAAADQLDRPGDRDARPEGSVGKLYPLQPHQHVVVEQHNPLRHKRRRYRAQVIKSINLSMKCPTLTYSFSLSVVGDTRVTKPLS